MADIRAPRIAAMDIARGFAILCVVVGHSGGFGIPEEVINFCFTFHMPLFFIVSGYFMRPDLKLDRAFFRKNVRTLIYPYVLTSLVVVLLTFIVGIVLGHPSVLADARTMAIAALYGSGTNAGMPEGIRYIGAIWFLLALFWARLFLVAANSCPFTPWIVAGLFTVGYASVDHMLPWAIQPGLCATLFLYIGQKMREQDVFALKRLPGIIWVAIGGGWLYTIVCGGHLYMVGNVYKDGIAIDVMGGVCGTMCIIKLALILEQIIPRITAGFALLGTATLPFFCMHLVELDVLPWRSVIVMLETLPLPLWLTGLMLRFGCIAILMIVLYVTPSFISGIFYPSRRKNKSFLADSGRR